MDCKSYTGYLPKFIINTGASAVYQEPTKGLSNPSDDYSNQSKEVLLLLCGFYIKGHCVTLDNYNSSPEIVKELLTLGNDCCRTLLKKEIFGSENP